MKLIIEIEADSPKKLIGQLELLTARIDGSSYIEDAVNVSSNTSDEGPEGSTFHPLTGVNVRIHTAVMVPYDFETETDLSA